MLCATSQTDTARSKSSMKWVPVTRCPAGKDTRAHPALPETSRCTEPDIRCDEPGLKIIIWGARNRSFWVKETRGSRW
jgi:hypothetical protein